MASIQSIYKDQLSPHTSSKQWGFGGKTKPQNYHLHQHQKRKGRIIQVKIQQNLYTVYMLKLPYTEKKSTKMWTNGVEEHVHRLEIQLFKEVR